MWAHEIRAGWRGHEIGILSLRSLGSCGGGVSGCSWFSSNYCNNGRYIRGDNRGDSWRDDGRDNNFWHNRDLTCGRLTQRSLASRHWCYSRAGGFLSCLRSFLSLSRFSCFTLSLKRTIAMSALL